MKKIISIIITIIVISVVVMFIFVPKKEFSYNENRYLEKFPEVNIDNIISGKFMNKLDSYIADNFPFRESLLSLKSKLFRVLGVYKQSDVYYGSDNKLYQEYKEPSNSDVVIKRVNRLKDNIDSDVYFMLVPTSIYVNNDKVSKYNLSYDEGKTIDYYKDNLDVKFIDVRDSFKKNREDYLFYGTDHHWTTRGANVAYLEYCKEVGIKSNNYEYSVVNDKFYGTLYSKVLDNSLEYDYIERIKDDTKYKVYFDDNSEESDTLYYDEYLDKKDKYSYFLDSNHSLIKIENLDSKNDNNILIIKDSYANSFIPLIGPHYKNIYVIDPRYYTLSISDYIKENDIEEVLFIYNVLTLGDDLGIVGIK